MYLEIKQITFSELEKIWNFKHLVEEYLEETTIKDMPKGYIDSETYRKADSLNTFKVYAAYYAENLIGFMTTITMLSLHRGVLMTTCDAIFISKKYRSTGAGIKLIKTAVSTAKEAGSFGVLFTAPVGGSLDDLLLKMDCDKVQHVYLKRLNDE